MAGSGLAVVIYYLAGTLALVGFMRSSRSALRLPLDLRCLEWRLFRDVLKVGGLSAIGTVQSNLTVVLVTGAVGLFGTDAIAGYGIASRLDYLLIPLLFGLGTAALTMVGTNIGAGQTSRAEHIAWTGAWVAAGFTEAIGLAAAIFPGAWLALFTADPSVLTVGALYLHTVAPFYGAFGLGLLLYFSGQGAGRVLWPVLAGTTRLIIAAVVGWLVVAVFGGGLVALFIAVSIASLAFGGITAGALWFSGWASDRTVAASG
jgi:Na+-driven multidrug efflux pump